jgi:hypothetical protein
LGGKIRRKGKKKEEKTIVREKELSLMPDYAKNSLLRYRWQGQTMDLRELVGIIKSDTNWYKTEAYRAMMTALRPIVVEPKEVERDLRGAPLSGADLGKANLSGADLLKVDLSGAYLRAANLSGANLWGANLSKAQLQSANLSKANLWGCNLSGADLTEADLSGTNLSETNFSGANLWKANLSGANLKQANVSGTNLWETNISGGDFGEIIYTTDQVTNRLVNWWGPRILHRIPLLNHFKCVQNWKEIGVTNLRGIDTTKMNGSKNPILKRHIEDYQYIQEVKRKTWFHRWIFYPIWKATSDCGRSLTLWLMWSAAIVGFFWVAYSRYLSDSFGQAHSKWPGIWYFSLMKFTTLGFHTTTPEVGNPSARTWVMAEMIMGYVMLAILISLLANKFARRA